MDLHAWTRRSVLIEAAEDDSDTMPDICPVCMSLDECSGSGSVQYRWIHRLPRPETLYGSEVRFTFV